MKKRQKKKTLVFDLDETLVKVIYIEDELKRKEFLAQNTWKEVPIKYKNGYTIPFLVNIRPGALEML